MFLAACGSQPAAMDPQPSIGTTTAGATAGPGAPVPSGGAAGSGAGATTVMCGATTCSNPAVAILSTIKMFMPNAMLATPCCLADGGCGWVGAAGECTPPPNKASCPAPSIPLPGAMLTGCCIESSQTCGIDSSALGMGCAANMFGGGARTNCDGTSAAPPAGAAAGAPATGAAGAPAGAAGAAGSATGAAGGGAAGTAAAAGTGAATAGRAAAGAGAATAGSSATAGSAATAGRGGSTAASAGAGGR